VCVSLMANAVSGFKFQVSSEKAWEEH